MFLKLRRWWYLRRHAICVGGPLEGNMVSRRRKAWCAVRKVGKPITYVLVPYGSAEMRDAVKLAKAGEVRITGLYALTRAGTFAWARNEDPETSGRRRDS